MTPNVTLDIISGQTGNEGRRIEQYTLDAIATIGAHGNEPYSIRVKNNGNKRIAIKIAVDGTDVMTGRPAELQYDHNCFIVEPFSSATLKAWVETNRSGAQFVFTSVGNSVAANTHGQLGALGYISVAVWEEGYQPITIRHDVFGGGYRGGDQPELLSKGAMRGGGVGTGAGQTVEQNIGTTRGLNQPVFAGISQVRYMWWDDLLAALQANPPVPAHPTGFTSAPAQPHADLGTTPRLNTGTAADVAFTATQPQYKRLS